LFGFDLNVNWVINPTRSLNTGLHVELRQGRDTDELMT